MKKKILKTLPFLLAIFALNINVIAQDQHQKEPRRQKHNVDAIVDSLKLDEQKAEQFKTLYEERKNDITKERKERMEMNKTQKAQRAELNKTHQEAYKEYQEKLKEILTEDEMEQLYSMQKAKKQNYKDNDKKDEKTCHKEGQECCKKGKYKGKHMGKKEHLKDGQQQPYKRNYKVGKNQIKE